MTLSIEELRQIKYQQGRWPDLYARGLRPHIQLRIAAVAARKVPLDSRDEVIDDILVNIYDRRAMRGSLLATWDESRDALLYIADRRFIENKVKDARRKICPKDITIQPLPDTLTAPDAVARVRHRLVLSDPARPITQPLLAAALQYYDQIDWTADGHGALHNAIEQVIGPPTPLERLDDVRREAMRAIEEKIATHAEDLQKARSPARREDLEREIDQLHALRVLMPLKAAHLAKLMHIDKGNAYQLISRYARELGHFFIVREADAPPDAWEDDDATA